MTRKAFESISEDHQKTVKEVFRKKLLPLNAQTRKDNEEALKVMADEGIRYVEVSPQELAGMIKEGAMADRNFRFERHYELWKEQNRQLTRWALATAIFATIVLLRVLVPFTDLSEQFAVRERELTKVSEDLTNAEKELATLVTIDKRLGAVRTAIERQPWMAEKERLIGTLRGLDQAYRTLSNASLVDVREAIQAPIPTLQGGIAQQVPPSPGQPQLHPLVQAATTLRIGADQLSGVESTGAFHQLLEAQTRRRVQEEADDKVRRIVKRVNDVVVKPLDQLLREEPAAGKVLVAMSRLLDRMRGDMDQWAGEHMGNRSWYASIQSKDKELGELTESLRQRQQMFIEFVKEQQQKLERRKKTLAKEQQLKRDQVSQIEKVMADLNVKMQKVFPDWLRDLVLPEEMLQLYPLVLLVSVVVIGFKAGLIRRHFLIVRQGHRPQDLSLRDPAMSSLWTLVRRTPLGTAVTAAVYLGGIILLWLLFERGSGLAATWLTEHSDAAWVWARVSLPAAPWLGRLLFAAAAVAVVTTLLRDRGTVSRGHSPATAS